ncbi:MAG: SufE family protein [Bacteroidota bacterium]
MDYYIPPTILEQQRVLIETFKAFEGHDDMALDYIMEMGSTLPSMPVALRTDDHLLPGCLAKVWVAHRHYQERTFFQGDSNAMITKGVLALLFYVFSGQEDQDIVDADFSFIEQIGLTRLLGAQRRSGLGRMLAYIRQAASYSSSEKK